ncbi:hypothetical protein DLP3_083 [Stenotrophomonas phage vB_SmaS_DLP_3]|nr:hypothetical protein DLP3_083 [Stenotrophomonas phage vB_SmaS_DLP_3]
MQWLLCWIGIHRYEVTQFGGKSLWWKCKKCGHVHYWFEGRP